MAAYGVMSNATGSRADNIDFDDIEVPKNIGNAEAREKLRQRISEATHIIVPGGQKTYIGTPHTHDSLYDEQVEGGAAVLKIPLFGRAQRFDDTETQTDTRYRLNIDPGPDGLYVFVGIHKFARLLVEGRDYTVDRPRARARRATAQRDGRVRRLRLARALHPQRPRAPAARHPDAERVGLAVPARGEADARDPPRPGEARAVRRAAAASNSRTARCA
jgi:hypothetical protein